ncbi:beta-ketoacyl synthase N-terminal-like domain-containing protein [Streptococcus orisasini]|uniref:beta-ketoacyl synthase N-terminal-like domain-containing protein n=1 Tax=Streptococcus orisasini TaxID=1080071 RepID=UPI00070BCF0D|nr:beta-ketoacyl synthase N-terminal-like domain-containing protein [Streptococcus orisasini]
MDKFAIIGMSGRFPDAKSPEEFFENLLAGKSSFRELTEEEKNNSPYSEDETFVPVTSTMSDVYKFDANLFKMTGHEAKLTDPQQRIFLKCCYEALEDASHFNYKGKIGVFASTAQSSYFVSNLLLSNGIGKIFDYSTYIGNETDFNATRVAYKLNLTGPAMSVQCGCSSSLVALNEACQNIIQGNCDVAIVGGVSITFPLSCGYSYKEGTTFSRSGELRPFDKNADGMIKGDGCGAIVIKKLEAAEENRDNIYAVISSIGIGNDGNRKVGYTAPSIRGEREAIKSAIDSSDINVEDLVYVETHGTGTVIGDPIEIRALSQAYQFKTMHRIGSLKANIGHLDTASGIAGVIKSTLILKENIIPKCVGFESENPNLNLAKSNLFIDTESNVALVPNAKNCVGVSSFGIGGTNVHVILENYINQNDLNVRNDEDIVIQISANNSESLDAYRKKLANYLQKHQEIKLIDVARTLNNGRKHYLICKNYKASSVEELINKLVTDYCTDEKVTLVKDGHFISLPTYCFSEKEYKFDSNLSRTTVNKEKKSETRTINSDEESLNKVCEIWSEELEEDVHPDSDFFELNGDSLIAIDIIDRINKEFEVTLNTNVLLNNATPRACLALISKSVKEKNSNILCLRHQNDAQKNLFLVHPAGGSVYCFKELFNNINLDKLNIYAISFPDNITPNLTISELAELYYDEIKKIQPTGSYLLGGYSFGGNVSIQIARLIESDGKHVDKLFMIDSLIPESYPSEQPEETVYKKLFSNVLLLMFNNRIDLDIEYVKKYTKMDDIISAMKDHNHIPRSIENEKILKIFNIWENNHIALLKQSRTKVLSDIVIFSAKDSMPDIMYESMRMTKTLANDWQKYTEGALKIVPVLGDHFSCMSNKEYLKNLSRQFKQELVECE